MYVVIAISLHNCRQGVANEREKERARERESAQKRERERERERKREDARKSAKERERERERVDARAEQLRYLQRDNMKPALPHTLLLLSDHSYYMQSTNSFTCMSHLLE